NQALAIPYLHTRLYALADLRRFRREVLDAAHEANAFVEIDERHVDVTAFRWLAAHGGHRVDGARALRDDPFERRAVAMRTNFARVVHVLVACGAALDQE